MIVLLLFIIIISLYGISFKKINEIDSDALSIKRTTMINGIFVLLVLVSHFNGYVPEYHDQNKLYIWIFTLIGQLMVTTFLFYSGYGIYESIKNKKNYLDNFFKNRIVKLFIRFFVAILFFLALDIIIGQTYSLKTILLSFIGWESVGNSNWFIFAMFYLYFAILIAFKICKNHKNAINLMTMFSLLYIFLILLFKKGSYWCDTIFCFNLGLYFSYYKDKIFSYLNKRYYLVTLLSVVLFCICFLLKSSFSGIINLFIYEICALSFVSCIILISFKIYFGNKILYFLGKNVFNIYILQRIGFILFNYLGLKNTNIYLYFLVSILFTLLLSYLFDKLLDIINKTLIGKKA